MGARIVTPGPRIGHVEKLLFPNETEDKETTGNQLPYQKRKMTMRGDSGATEARRGEGMRRDGTRCRMAD